VLHAFSVHGKAAVDTQPNLSRIRRSHIIQIDRRVDSCSLQVRRRREKNETLHIGRNITFDPHIEPKNCAACAKRTRTNFFFSRSSCIPLFSVYSKYIPRTPRSFKTKMYVPFGGGSGGRGARCLFVTAKRDFCGNGEKNCNRDLWSVSIDANLVFFFISNGTRARDL